MLKTPEEVQTFEAIGETITQEACDKLIQATRSEHISGVPPTFVTRFRDTEYKLLDHLGISMKYLLHGEQEFEFHSPVKIGVKPTLKTRLADLKERKRKTEIMRFLKFESELRCEGQLCVIGRTTFVVREPIAETS